MQFAYPQSYDMLNMFGVFRALFPSLVPASFRQLYLVVYSYRYITLLLPFGSLSVLLRKCLRYSVTKHKLCLNAIVVQRTHWIDAFVAILL